MPAVIIGPHPQGRSREIHHCDSQHDEHRNQFVETVVRIEEKVVTANPEPREIERHGRHGYVDIKRQFDPLFAQPESGDTDQQGHGEQCRNVFVAQVMNDVKQDVAVEERNQEPNRGIEADQFVPPENQQELAPAYRKLKRSGQRLRNTVHQQERTQVKDQERHEQFVCFTEEEARKSLVGLEEKPRNEEIERHDETRQDSPGRGTVEDSPDMHHHNQHDTQTFRKVDEINPPSQLFVHCGKDNNFGLTI